MSKQADKDAEIDADGKTRAPESNLGIELGGVKVVLVEPRQEAVEKLVEQHEDGVHHVVHVRGGHGVGFGCTEQIVESGLHEIGVHDLEDAHEYDQDGGDEEVRSKVNAREPDKGEMPNIKDINVDRVGLIQRNHDDVDNHEDQQEVEGVGRSPGNGCEGGPAGIGDGELEARGLDKLSECARKCPGEDGNDRADAGDCDAELDAALEGF